jgi:hypothetical protein
VTFHVPKREQTFVDHYGVDIDYFKYPHYQGFSVSLRVGGAC